MRYLGISEALQLMTLTFVRTSELIGARWSEFDMKEARWDIPAERMKMKTPHIVPLSKQAKVVLDKLKAISFGRELVFPGDPGTGGLRCAVTFGIVDPRLERGGRPSARAATVDKRLSK